jgi:hypothetical protein
MGANRAGAAPTQPPLPYSGGPVFLGKFLLGEPGAGGRGRNREMESSVTSASLWDQIKRARSISPCLARSGPGGRPWRLKSWGVDIDSRRKYGGAVRGTGDVGVSEPEPELSWVRAAR